MPINCKICNKEFQKLVTHTHLAQHNISSNDYKVQYGAISLSSPEYRLSRRIASTGKHNPNFGKTLSATARKKISDANTGKVPHNKGIPCLATTKLAVSKANTGKVPHNKGKLASNETKQKIKTARANQSITSASVKKPWRLKRRMAIILLFLKERHILQNLKN